jgi:hypothetical protein
MTANVWTWRFEPDGVEVEDPGIFGNQSDAESWLGEAWRRLSDAGVTGASMYHGAERVYGPMPLEE